MNYNNYINFLEKFDLSVYKHASNLLKKFNDWNKISTDQKNALIDIFEHYRQYITIQEDIIGYDENAIIDRTDALNRYYQFMRDKNYDNIFSSQWKLRPTILEEFMYILFRDLIKKQVSEIGCDDRLRLGSSRAYTNLFFSGLNFKNFINTPQIGINQKDQDFTIYRPISISVWNSSEIKTNLPIVAIENKTYIDKTMLEGSIATAEKIKSWNPYSLFFIVAETYDVDLRIDPAYSKIDQIYILRKTSRKDWFQPIYEDVLIDLIKEVEKHLSRDWSNVQNKLKNSGKII